MIQRIQSLYLLLIALLSALLFIFPFQTNIVSLSEILHIKLNFFDTENRILLIAAILNLIIISDTLVTIFLFKNRKLQMMLCYYLAALNIALVVLMYIGASEKQGLPTYRLPFVIPVINVILSLIARYFIQKDESLVKSADRIR